MFERVAAPDQKRVVHSQRARLLSLAVERGESPSPFVPVGMFRATYRAIVPLPARDRFHFRIEGRGSVQLSLADSQDTAIVGSVVYGLYSYATYQPAIEVSRHSGREAGFNVMIPSLASSPPKPRRMP